MQLAVRSRVVSFEVWQRSTVLVCAANGEQDVKGRDTHVSDQLRKYVIYANKLLLSYETCMFDGNRARFVILSTFRRAHLKARRITPMR